MKNILLITAFLLIAQNLLGQYHTTVTYNEKDGLPDSKLVQIFSDSRGLIWISTNYGLIRFDGNSFNHLTEEDGLPDMAVRTIIEDNNGNIWLQHELSIDPNNLHISVLEPSGRINGFYDFQGKGEGSSILFQDMFTREILLLDGAGNIWSFDNESRVMNIEERLEYREAPVTTTPLSDPYKKRWVFRHSSEKGGEQGQLLMKEGNDFWEIAPPEAIEPKQVIPLGFLPDGGLICQLNRSHFYRYHEDEGWSRLAPVSVVDINQNIQQCPDNESILLGVSPNEGIGRIIEFSPCFPNGIEYPFLSDKPFGYERVVRGKDGSFWIATSTGLVRLFPGFIDLEKELQSRVISDFFASGIIISQADQLNPFFQYLSGEYDGGSNVSSENWQKGVYDPKLNPIELNGYQGSFFHESFDGEIGFVHAKEGLIINSNPSCLEDSCWIRIGPDKGFDSSGALTTVKDDYGRWWIGRFESQKTKQFLLGKEGAGRALIGNSRGAIAFYDSVEDTVYTYLSEDKDLDFGVISSLRDNRGNLWFGTSRGLVFFEVKKKIDPNLFSLITDFIEVGSEIIGKDRVNALVQLDSNALAIGTEKGIALLDLSSFYEGKSAVRFFDETNGFSGNNVAENAFWVDPNGGLWVGSDIGVHRLDNRYYSLEPSMPFVQIDSLFAGGTTYFDLDPDKSIRVRTQDRPIQIYCSTSFDSLLLNDVTYWYRILGDSLFSPASKESGISVPLGPGKYCVQLKAIRGGVESDIQDVYIEVQKPFFRRLWPWISGLLVLSLLIERYLGRQRVERTKLQLQAIVNQLNPHFINNALQWVQVRVYNDEEAVQVISKLGENIRIVFKNSRKKRAFHTLADEMKLVENYLFVQKKRFGKKVEYYLPDPAILDRVGTVNVPLMQIQIHCENAAEHGIRNKEDDEQGIVRVNIVEETEYLYITVEDNGVGRKRASKLGSKGTQQGTKMLDSMRDIFNRRNRLPLKYHYEDDIFTNDQGEKYGTRVHIRIPKTYNYELR